MTIAIETILALLGALLILTGGIGGGFEIKEAKIPKVGLGGRIVSLVMGVCCLIIAVGMSIGDDEDEEDASTEDPIEETDVEMRMGETVEEDLEPFEGPPLRDEEEEDLIPLDPPPYPEPIQYVPFNGDEDTSPVPPPPPLPPPPEPRFPPEP
jgi:hypothetical protein